MQVLGAKGNLPRLDHSRHVKPRTRPQRWGFQLRSSEVPMLWLKAFHIIFVVTWFAGLFYLPRLFVYHADAQDSISIERFRIMERKLLIMMTIGAALAAVFGISLVLSSPAFMQMHWLHAKLTLVAVLIAYHIWCFQLVRAFRCGANRHTARWYRMFNEVPSVLLIGIVLLVVLKPF
jgi:putative membrane protein